MSAWCEEIISYDRNGMEVARLRKPDLRETEYEWKTVGYAPTPMGNKKLRIPGFNQLHARNLSPVLQKKMGIEPSTAYETLVSIVFFASSIQFLTQNPVIEVFDRETGEWASTQLNEHFSDSFVKQLKELATTPDARLHVFWINP